MRHGRLNWLEERMGVLRTFDGSLLKYVDSTKERKKVKARPKVESSRILKLDSNENFFVEPRDLAAILRGAIRNLDLRVYDPQCIEELKKALGQYVGVPAECIIVASGSEQLIDLVVDLFVRKGDNVVSIEPSFFAYEKRVLLKEGEFFGVPLKEDLSLDRKAMLKRSNTRTRLAFVCSPNNPTGNVFEPAEVEALADESSAILVVDEAYAEFADSTLAPLAATKKNVVVLRTFSKAFGLAGLRFGYAVANPDMALPLSNIMPYTVNSVTSRFVVRLLSHLDIIERCTEMVKAERERLIEGLDSTRGIVALESKANFVTFRPGKDPAEVCEELLRRGILVKDLGDLPVIGHCLRVTVGLPSMNDRFLKALAEIIS